MANAIILLMAQWVLPVVSVNHADNNIPSGVGLPLPDVEVRIGDQDELLIRGPSVMLGYWKNAEATDESIDADGWLHSGDQARIEDGHLFITGRLKEIIVLATGEKVPPTDMELAIAIDPLIEQVMVFGDNRSCLGALVVLTAEQKIVADSAELLEELLQRIAQQLHQFPGYAQVRRVAVVTEPWSVENELMTPTLKLRRKQIVERYSTQIEQLYTK